MRAPTAVRIREIATADDGALAEIHALLRRSFHRHERVSLREWRSTLREKTRGVWTDYAWHLLVAEHGARVVGLTAGTYVGNVNVGIIGYLAIAPEFQAGGLGSRLRARLRHTFERDARQIAGRPLDAVLGEVSADNPWLTSLSRRSNVLILDLPYFQPSLGPGDPPSPYVLYYESLRRPRRYIPAGELRQLLYAVWRRAYRISRPLEHAAFRRMLRSLDGRRRIGPHPDFRRHQSR